MYTIFFNKINTTALGLETSGPYDAVQSGLYVSPIHKIKFLTSWSMSLIPATLTQWHLIT
jgi:hypothetical protein